MLEPVSRVATDEKREMNATLERIVDLYRKLRGSTKAEFARSSSFGDYFANRWERAVF
jgi:hypothetical protein